jgi:hypothetical protein
LTVNIRGLSDDFTGCPDTYSYLLLLLLTEAEVDELNAHGPVPGVELLVGYHCGFLRVNAAHAL